MIAKSFVQGFSGDSRQTKPTPLLRAAGAKFKDTLGYVTREQPVNNPLFHKEVESTGFKIPPPPKLPGIKTYVKGNKWFKRAKARKRRGK
jgi:hypothetical protein